MIISIWPSDRKGKKWMARVDETGQKVYFGQAGAEDFTTHKDEAKRKRWLARHKVEPWKPALNLTPAWLSRHLLWEKDDMNKAMAEASVMYPDIRFRWGAKPVPPPPAAPPPETPSERRSTSRSPTTIRESSASRSPSGPIPRLPRLVPPRPPPPPRPTLGEAREDLERRREQLAQARAQGDDRAVRRLQRTIDVIVDYIQRVEARRRR